MSSDREGTTDPPAEYGGNGSAPPPGRLPDPGPTAAAVAGSTTMTITEERAGPSTEQERLTLRLRARPSVQWDESVVDNEGMGRKSSKRCCIFHKQREFGESSTDSSDCDSDGSDSSSNSGAVDGDGDKKRTGSKKPRGKIARPKQKDVPDYQRYHA